MSVELEASSALARIEGYFEEAWLLVDWWILTVGSIWSVVVGWILLRPCPMMVRLLADLEVPILMGLERTVKSAAGLGQRGKACPVARMCRGRVFERPVRNLTFPHSWLMGENSTRGLVLVALAARAVDGSSDQVGSEALAGMARMLVWPLLLSATARRPMRSCPQYPVSGLGKNQ